MGVFVREPLDLNKNEDVIHNIIELPEYDIRELEDLYEITNDLTEFN